MFLEGSLRRAQQHSCWAAEEWKLCLGGTLNLSCWRTAFIRNCGTWAFCFEVNSIFLGELLNHRSACSEGFDMPMSVTIEKSYMPYNGGNKLWGKYHSRINLPYTPHVVFLCSSASSEGLGADSNCLQRYFFFCDCSLSVCQCFSFAEKTICNVDTVGYIKLPADTFYFRIIPHTVKWRTGRLE